MRREIGRGPAIAYRTGVTVDANHRPEARFRAIFIGRWHQYDRLHLNLDVSVPQSRHPRLGGILGYSSPLGYPRHFETTLLAEVGVETRWSGSFVGVGLRRQLSPTLILDAGIHAPFQFTLGLSQAF